MIVCDVGDIYCSTYELITDVIGLFNGRRRTADKYTQQRQHYRSLQKFGHGHLSCWMCLERCVARDGADVFRTVIGSYEDRQRLLMSENGDLRNALRDLQKQLIAMLHADDGHSIGKKSAEVCSCVSVYDTWNCCTNLYSSVQM